MDALLKENIEADKVKEFEVPEFVVGKDVRSIVKEEEAQYNALKNQLIEVQLGAKEALRLIKKELIK